MSFVNYGSRETIISFISYESYELRNTVFRQRLTRQKLTHFLKILEIFKIRKFFGELCQNPQFLVKIIFGVTLILY